MSSWSDIDNNLLNPEWYPQDTYHAAFKRLRDEDPLHWAEDERFGRNYWVVTRYDDVKAIVNDTLRFSSMIDSRPPRQPNRLSTLQRHEVMFDASLAFMDPPVHTSYRAPINKHFSVPAIGRMSSDIGVIIDELLDDLAEHAETDFVAAVAAELPMRVVFALLGVPQSDWKLMEKYAWQAFSPADPKGAIPGLTVAETSFAGLKAIGDYGLEMARDRQKNPRDDLATIISQLVVDGTVLDEHEIAQWFQGLIIGGLETTRNTASTGLWLFMNNPDQRAALVNDPSLAKSAVEEIIRWTTPARGRLRVARTQYEMHGKTINPTDWVISFLESANRDERHFTNPDAFDISRSPNDHIALGVGAHLCLGRALVRLELAQLFPRLFERFPAIELAGNGKPHWIVDHQVNGLTELQIRPGPTKALVHGRR